MNPVSTFQASLVSSLIALGAFGAVAPAPSPLTSTERKALAGLEDDALLSLRGGSMVGAPLEAIERAELERLDQTTQLEAQRAGDLDVSNSTLVTILLVLGILAALVIIL